MRRILWRIVASVLSRHRLCCNREINQDVILNKVKNLDRSIGYKRRDPSASPQDDIATQFPTGKNETGAEWRG